MTIHSCGNPAPRLYAHLSLGLAAILCAGGVAFPPAHAAEPGTDAPASFATVGVPDFSQITRRYGSTVVNISISGMRQVSVGPDTSDTAGDDNDADSMQQFLRRFQQQFGGTGASMQVPSPDAARRPLAPTRSPIRATSARTSIATSAASDLGLSLPRSSPARTALVSALQIRE